MGEPLTDEQVQAWREEATEDMQVMLGLRSDLGPYEVLQLCDERDRLRGEVDALRKVAQMARGREVGCSCGARWAVWTVEEEAMIEAALAAVPAGCSLAGGTRGERARVMYDVQMNQEEAAEIDTRRDARGERERAELERSIVDLVVRMRRSDARFEASHWCSLSNDLNATLDKYLALDAPPAGREGGE